jgi:hypothetical protein
VYRLTQGQRFAYTATARWSEYKPDQNDFMWRKMPHTMLGKCAEALALRKGFPRQLAGLYAKEELDQANVEPVIQLQASTERRENPVAVTGETHGQPSDDGPDLGVDLPPGALLVTNVEVTATNNPNVKKALINFSDGKVRSTINTPLINTAEQCLAQRIPVWVTDKTTKWGIDLVSMSREEP